MAGVGYVYKLRYAALTLDRCAVDKRQENDRDEPAHIGLFVQDVDGASVKGVSTADSGYAKITTLIRFTSPAVGAPPL
jgi:hypothetical protein